MITTRFFSPDPWLAETLSRPVFKLVGSPGAPSEGELSAEMVALVQRRATFFYGKLSTVEVASCLALTRAGLTVVDTSITFGWTGPTESPPRDVSVGVVGPLHREAVVEIAGRCFRYSRFHLDPGIPLELANRIKRRWIESYCLGLRGTALYFAQVDETIVGFLAVIESHVGNRSVATIDLVGVAPEFQGRGVGTALVARFVDDWHAKATELRVGTQAANIPSLRFYERNGFRVIESAYVLHAHFGSEGICQ